MPLEPFDQICHEIARADARLVVIPEKAGVTPGKYALREFYCVDPACDCRRMVAQFLPFDPGTPDVAATLSFGWERPKYYRKRFPDPDVAPATAGVQLPPDLEQGPNARAFLIIFKNSVKDQQLLAAFKRHYRLVKETMKARAAAYEKLSRDYLTANSDKQS